VSENRHGKEPTFEDEELFAGLEGEERADRVELLRQLSDAGFGIGELKRAAAEDRLVMLPVERVFAGETAHTLSEYAELTGLEPEFIRRDWTALGLPRPDPTRAVFSPADVSSGRLLKQVLDAGVPEEDILELARVVGRASAATAEAILEILVRSFLRPGESESDVGAQFGHLATELTPLLAPLLENPVRLHMREVIRREVIGRAERTSGRLPGAREMSICFADLVGFTRFSETASADSVTDVAQRLEHLAAEVAEAPVRLVKTIGDAAMLVSAETSPLVEATLRLIDDVESDKCLPSLRAGIARGPALGRAGDWYGRPVNLASRIAGVADEGSLFVTAGAAEDLGRPFRTEPRDPVELKGIDRAVDIRCVSRA